METGEDDSLRDGEGRLFCCEGCRAVYGFIRGEGLESFYHRRDWKAGEAQRPAVPPAVDPVPFEEKAREEDGLREVDFYVDGVRCASCVWLVEKVLHRTKGVAYARINYGTHRARVRWDPAAVGLQEVLLRVASTGYVPKPYSESERLLARKAESRDLLVRFGTAAFLSCQLMLYSVALYAGYFQGMEEGTKRLFGFIALALTTPVLFYAGQPLLRNALAGLRRLRVTMDSLIVLGAGSAYLYSMYALARGGEVYFDTAAMIVTLILLGRYLESQAKGKASEALERLSELSPRKAVKVTFGEGGALSRETVESSSLSAGDLVEVKPGEKFPADGVVARGESTSDESLLTGESRPVPKSPGAPVVGGSLNGYGSVVFEVTKTGRDTILAKIAAAVEEAQASRPPIQGVADRVIGFFVPAVLTLAALTVAGHLAWGQGGEKALMTGISVLVIACPCSLGLATPLAVLVYTGRASSKGILIKGGETAENAASVTRVIFDKTGTVTKGAVSLRAVGVADSRLDREHCLELAASLEVRSEHALGAALVEAAAGRTPYAVTSFQALPGRGVSGHVEGREVFVGSRVWMAEQGMKADPPWDGPVPAPAREGDTIVYMAWEGKVRAFFVLTDGLREEAKQVVASLLEAGLKVSLVSGDGPGATASVAQRAGFEDFEAEATPERKRELIAAAQSRGEQVLMVGDGINDAPALTEALVGVAVGRGTDIAMESADAVLVRNDLRLVSWFLNLAGGSFRIIRQNIFWAFFYNIAALPLAVAGVMHPIVAAAAMASSSLFVVLNSLRIRRIGGEGV